MYRRNLKINNNNDAGKWILTHLDANINTSFSAFFWEQFLCDVIERPEPAAKQITLLSRTGDFLL